jgi:hypothetical protein
MRSAIVIATAVLAIAFAPSALAVGNGPTSSVYDQKGKQVQTEVNVAPAQATQTTKPPAQPAPVATEAVASSGTLPFTGLDLGFLAAAGAVLVAMGISLRRITRKRDTTV